MKKRWLRPSPLAPEGVTLSACSPMVGHPGPSAQGADGASSPHHSAEAGAKVSAKEPTSVSIPEDAGRKFSDVRRTISGDVAVGTSSSATSPALWQGVQPDWEHAAALSLSLPGAQFMPSTLAVTPPAPPYMPHATRYGSAPLERARDRLRPLLPRRETLILPSPHPDLSARVARGAGPKICPHFVW